MQLTSPAFLFLFLPLSLPLVLLVPGKLRRCALSLLSVLFLVVANRTNPVGMAHIAALVLFGLLAAYLPMPRRMLWAGLRITLSVAVPLLSLIAARLLCEYAPEAYAYPTGLLFVTLGVISYVIDRARGDVLCPRNPLELAGYFLFFPTVLMGPLLRSKQYFDLTEEIAFSPTLFVQGIRAYMLGYIKYLAVGAVALRALTDILERSALFFHPVSLLLLFLLSYICFYFLVTGLGDMARGVCAMYGIAVPAQGRGRLRSAAPHALLQSVLPSVRSYLLDYVYTPLRYRFGPRKGRILCAVLIPVLTVLIWRTRPEMLLLAFPILLCGVLVLLPRVKRFFAPRNVLCRLALSLLGALLCFAFTLATVLENPWDIFELIAAAGAGARIGFVPHAIFGVMQDAAYLAILGAVLVPVTLYSHLRPLILRRGGKCVRTVLAMAEMLLLFVGFALCTVYFMPQFPRLAEVGVYRM